MELELVVPRELLVAPVAGEPLVLGVDPVMPLQLVHPDEAGPAVGEGAVVRPGAHVVPDVRLEMVLLGECSATVGKVANVSVNVGHLLAVWALAWGSSSTRSATPPALSGNVWQILRWRRRNVIWWSQ